MPEHNKIDLNEQLFNVSDMVTVFYLEFYQQYFKETNFLYDFWQVNLNFKGTRVLKIDDSIFTLNKGQMIFIKPDTPFEVMSSYGFNNVGVCSFVCDSAAMEIFNNRIVDLTEEEIELFHKFIFLGVPSFDIVDDHTMYGFKPKNNILPGTLQALKMYLELFLISVYNRLKNGSHAINLINNNLYTNDSKLVSATKEYFLENLCNNLTIDKLSNHFKLSPTTLKTVFKKETSHSLMNYYMNMRIEKSKSLIRSGAVTISEVSAELGFQSPTYFTSVFKKITGEKPLQYLKRHETIYSQIDRKFSKS